MKYKKYKGDAYNIYTVKTNRFKRCHLEIMFRDNIKKDDITKKVFLSELLSFSSKDYKTKREFNIAMEELYNSYFYSVTSKLGNLITTSYCFDFLSPKYCEKGTIKKMIEFPFKMLNNPNITNNEFDKQSFDIVKNMIEADIKSVKDSPKKKAILACLKEMDAKSPASFQVSGYMEDLELITPSGMAKYYEEVLEHDYVDILLIGNLNMDECVKIIKDSFKLNTLKTYKINIHSDLSTSKKEKIIRKEAPHTQSELVMGYNLVGLTKHEKDIVGSVFNSILGGDSLENKLAKYLRTENSLCYNVKSIFQKHNSLLLITSSINKDSFDLAVKLVKKSIKEMQEGIISDDELDNAKKNIKNSLKTVSDSEEGILSNYYFSELDNSPLIEERIELIDKVTKNDLVNFAKKVKINTIFLLEGNK